MKRLDRSGLKKILRALDARLDGPANLTLVGGAAMLLLTTDVRVTYDVDAMDDDDLDRIEAAAADLAAVDINTRSDAFEICLPEDWRDHLVRHALTGLTHLRVSTPRAEDLAVMKVFRFGPKDADDIARLARRPGFDRRRFLAGFRNAVRATIGEPSWHAHSFEMIWNRLFPDEPVDRRRLLDD